MANRVCEIRRLSAAPGSVASTPPGIRRRRRKLAGRQRLHPRLEAIGGNRDALAAFLLFDAHFGVRQRADDLEKFFRRQRQHARLTNRAFAPAAQADVEIGREQRDAVLRSRRSARSRESESCSSARRCLAEATTLSADRSCGRRVPWAGRPFAGSPAPTRGDLSLELTRSEKTKKYNRNKGLLVTETRLNKSFNFNNLACGRFCGDRGLRITARSCVKTGRPDRSIHRPSTGPHCGKLRARARKPVELRNESTRSGC